MGKNVAADDVLVTQTEKNVIDAWTELSSFNRQNQELMGKFAELVDTFNTAWEAHKKILKTVDRESSVFKMSEAPRGFILTDFDQAMELLGKRFTEYFEVKAKTEIVRNALKEGTCPGLEMVVNEIITGSPQHRGPKQIDISALSWKREDR